MPRVPQAQRLVNENAPGFTSLQAADYSEGGRDIARAGFGLGRDVGDAGAALAQVQDVEHEATAKALSADFSKAARPLVEQYNTLRGSQAMDGQKVVEGQLKTLFDDTIGKAGAGVVRGMLRPSLEAEHMQFMTGVGRHAVQQTQAYQHDSSIAYQTEKSQNAVLLADTPDFAPTLLAITGEIAQRGATEGLPTKVIEREQLQARSDVHKAVITGKLGGGDVKGAANWLTEHRGDILPTEAIGLDRMVHPELVKMQANAAVDSIRGTPDPDASMPVVNNNQGNIRSDPKIKWQGQVGVDARGFVIFDTPSNGLRALNLNLQSYLKNGFDTPLKIANRWAPKGDGKNDPVAYAHTMATTAGIGINDKVTPAALSRIASAIVQVENVASSPSRGGFKSQPKNAPGKPDLATHLALIDKMNLPEEVRDAAKQEVIRRDSMDRSLLAQRQGDSYDAAVATVNDLGTNFTSISQLGASYLGASEQQQASLNNLARSNAKGGAATDPATYYSLLQLEADDPTRFAKTDLLGYSDRLSWQDVKELGKRQVSALDRGGKPSPEAINRGRLFGVAKTAMAAAGIDVGGGKLDEDDANKRLMFIDAMAAEQAAWTAHNPGKAPDDQTIRGWAGRLLTKFEGNPLFEVGDEDVAERLTPKARKQVEANLRAAGRPVTDANVNAYFRRMVMGQTR